jgi:hypothetical protein
VVSDKEPVQSSPTLAEMPICLTTSASRDASVVRSVQQSILALVRCVQGVHLLIG